MKKTRIFGAIALAILLGCSATFAACGVIEFSGMKSAEVNAEQWADAFDKSGKLLDDENANATFQCQGTDEDKYTVKTYSETYEYADKITHVSYTSAGKGREVTAETFEFYTGKDENGSFQCVKNSKGEWIKEKESILDSIMSLGTEKAVMTFYVTLSQLNDKYEKFSYDSGAKGYVWKDENDSRTVTYTVKIVDGYVKGIKVVTEGKGDNADNKSDVTVTLSKLGETKVKLPKVKA